jgi:molecular chaperone GrpE
MEPDTTKTDDNAAVVPPADDATQKLSAAETKRDEYLAGWQRERADFQNFKKDEFRRLTEARGAITATLVEEILPVLDSFDIAFDFVPEDLANHKWIHGTDQIRLQLLDVLRREGLEPVKINVGETMFDPASHEAMEEVVSDAPEGTVLEEVQKGYVLNGRVVRPARVKVARKANNG